MFKEMTAEFKFHRDGSEDALTTVTVKRLRSGAFNYGDRSMHIVYVNDLEYKVFDTRYDGIQSKKTSWLNFWSQWVVDTFGVKDVILSLYKEMEVAE